LGSFIFCEGRSVSLRILFTLIGGILLSGWLLVLGLELFWISIQLGVWSAIFVKKLDEFDGFSVTI